MDLLFLFGNEGTISCLSYLLGHERVLLFWSGNFFSCLCIVLKWPTDQPLPTFDISYCPACPCAQINVNINVKITFYGTNVDIPPNQGHHKWRPPKAIGWHKNTVDSESTNFHNINMSLNKVSVLGASPSQFNPTLAVSDCLCARSASPISGGTVRLSLCLSVCAFSVCVSLSLSVSRLSLFLSRVSSESSRWLAVLSPSDWIHC